MVYFYNRPNEKQGGGLSIAHINRQIESVNKFYKYLRKRNYLQTQIRLRIRKPELGKELEVLSEKAIKELSKACDLLSFVGLQREKGNSWGTIKKRLLSIRHYYEMLKEEGIIKTNPGIELKLKNKARRGLDGMLEKEALDKLYEDYPVLGSCGYRNKGLLGMLIYQGLRTKELEELEGRDIDLRKGKVYIKGGVRSNSRRLDLSACQLLDLHYYEQVERPKLLLEKEESTDLYYLSRGKGKGIKNSLSYLLKSIQSQNGSVSRLAQIRSSVIRHWLKIYDLRKVQHMAGHKKVSSTERYDSKDLDRLQREINELHPLK